MEQRFKEYKVIRITENGCSTVLLGVATLPIDTIQQRINDEARNGWQVVFQIIERTRYLLFWERETMIVTFGR